MPKIEVDLVSLSQLAQRTWKDLNELEKNLITLKAELDDAEGNNLKIEFNDTNRPDLWSTAGAARALRLYQEVQPQAYTFFSTLEHGLETSGRVIKVDKKLKNIRPFIAAFVAKGPALTDAGLRDLIQTQEKLCWNYGRKRRSIAMGVYRSAQINWPIHYTAKDPKNTRFVPLGLGEELNLHEILEKHPKGKEYGHIVQPFPLFPFLEDSHHKVLSFPPIINAAHLGAVEVGDTEVLVEMTGTDLPSLSLAAAIVACDLADQGWNILPVKIEYEEPTPWGASLVYPLSFQKSVSVSKSSVTKLLGLELTDAEITQALARMGMHATIQNHQITIQPPVYRNDFLHPVDIIEDIMIGHGLERFTPTHPKDSTVGRLTPTEEKVRELRDLMIGLGYQEMIYNYLGSARDFIEKMNLDEKLFVRILNPMTENYEIVRNSIAPNLLETESVSASAVYPHRLFEIGKVVVRDSLDPTGTRTLDQLGFLIADRTADFNQINAVMYALAYYLNLNWEVEEYSDPRFIPGRAAQLKLNNHPMAVFGEIHPQILENWGINVPCAYGELNVGALIHG